MKEPSFTEHNHNFVAKCSDPSIFGSGDFNFIKIVQQALVQSARENSSQVIKNKLTWPLWQLRLFYIIRSIMKRKKKPTNISFRPVLFIENTRDRYTAHGEAVSMYYHRFYSLLQSNEFSVITKRKKPLVPARDFVLHELRNKISSFPLDAHASAVLRAMHRVLSKLKASKLFDSNEQVFIRSSMHVFFEDFLFWNTLFKDSGIKLLVFDNHYYNEGLIAAAKLHGIRTVELQHGLITNNDIFYVYPEFVRSAASKAFFPDTIFVYGEGWKKKLAIGAEHKSEDIVVMGDYTYSIPSKTSYGINQKEQLVFIGAQKFMGKFYIEYMHVLAKLFLEKHAGWKILIKHHPSEKDKEQYDVLLQYPNVSFAADTDDLQTLLRKSSIQISYYSTTLYDALGLEVLNFAVQDHSPYADYCREVVADGIALPIRVGEDPIELYHAHKDLAMCPREYYFAPFNAALAVQELARFK